MSPRPALAGLLWFVLALGAVPAEAHTGGSTGYVVLAIDRASIRYTLTLWPATLPPGIAQELQLARTGDAATSTRLSESLRGSITLIADGHRCTAGPGAFTSAAGESLAFVVDFACAAVVRDLGIRDDLFDVLGADHHTLARVDAAGRTWQFAFAPDAREGRLRVDTDASSMVGFVRLGVEHILTGYDHLLFLLGLMLPGGGVVALAKIVTAFTIAHSVTLAFAVLDIVSLPERLIEAVIALSIAAVAAENLFLRATIKRRWIVSFGFGLVHGFGFSTALREMRLPAHGLLLSLFGFNAGVELGQAAVIAVALPMLLAIRRIGYERWLVWSSSIAILVVGIALFVERVFL